MTNRMILKRQDLINHFKLIDYWLTFLNIDNQGIHDYNTFKTKALNNFNVFSNKIDIKCIHCKEPYIKESKEITHIIFKHDCKLYENIYEQKKITRIEVR